MAEAKAKKDKTYTVVVPSTTDIETKKIEGKKHVYGFVNGDYFEVPCDEQVEVSEAVYGVLSNSVVKIAENA